ncbi:MAG TPA: phosphopantetheine-binding protein [bacterium]|nr:phosphopantetheine-binding protein [bacterium]
MEKEQILGIVKKHLVNAVEGVSAEQIEGAKSMKDYGASSLDIVEVVSASMRELKIKIPRNELSGIKNIDGLADMFCRYATPQ